MSQKLLRHVREHQYLLEYLNKVSKSLGMPTFYEVSELDYSMKGSKTFNILYYVGNGIYIHVYTPLGGTESGYGKYVAVEPPRPDSALIELIENKLAEVITEADDIEDLDARRRILLSKLEQIIVVTETPVDYSKLKPNSKRIPVYQKDLDNLKYHIVRDRIGLGVIEPFIYDPWLEDISCKGKGHVYVFHKLFGPLETNIEFKTEMDLDEFVLDLAEKIGKPITHARPIVDATLPSGYRINIVFGLDVSLHGSNFTIRKSAEEPISVTQLIAWNTFDALMAAYLWMLLENNMSGFICGETASGKTTTLNAITAFIPSHYKIISIEDTAEVKLPHPNWVRELTRDTGNPGSSVTMFDLLRAALRQRPNYIIVGEIRGQEASIAFQAMQTGHPVLSTFHAASVERVIQRLTGDPIRVPKTFMDNLNFVLIQSATWRGGKLVRRVMSINEIMGYDPKADSIIYIPVFVWDPTRDIFTFRGKGASYLLNEKIALRRGIPRTRIKELYDELEKRARFLQLLVERKVFKYYDFWRAVIKAGELGLDATIKKLERGDLL